MKHSFLISYLILILSSGFAQQKGLKRSISDFSIKKTEEVFIEREVGNSPPHLLYFDRCIYNQENEFLPVYHELLPLAGISSVKQIVATKLQKLDPALNKLLKIDEARNAALKYVRSFRFEKNREDSLISLVHDLFSEQNLPKLKSEKKGKWLSLIPGAGHIYAGYWKRGSGKGYLLPGLSSASHEGPSMKAGY